MCVFVNFVHHTALHKTEQGNRRADAGRMHVDQHQERVQHEQFVPRHE